MGTVEHGRRVSITGIVLSILAWSSIGLTSNRSPCGVRPVNGVGRDEGSLRRDRMEEALLVEANAVLTAAIRRAVVARASNLEGG